MPVAPIGRGCHTAVAHEFPSAQQLESNQLEQITTWSHPDPQRVGGPTMLFPEHVGGPRQIFSYLTQNIAGSHQWLAAVTRNH